MAYGCRLNIDTFLKIIVACSVLHNLALAMGDEEPPALPEELDLHILTELILNGQIPNINNEAEANLAGVTRTVLINDYFHNLD